MSSTSFHSDYIAALVQLRRQGRTELNDGLIDEQIKRAVENTWHLAGWNDFPPADAVDMEERK